MMQGGSAKYVVAVAPAAILDDTSLTATVIDTKGASYAEIILQLGATDIAMTALKLTECDTSGGTYTDVTGTDFSSANDIDGNALALPSSTDDNQTIVMRGSLLGRKRYLKVVGTFGNGSLGGFIAGVCRLSSLNVAPSVSTDIANGSVAQF